MSISASVLDTSGDFFRVQFSSTALSFIVLLRSRDGGGLLDPPHQRLDGGAERYAHPLPYIARVGVRVVFGAAQLELPAAVPQRVCGAAIAVEGKADAAGVDQQPSALGLACELDVAVSEDHHL